LEKSQQCRRSHLFFGDQCKGGQLSWRTMVAVAFGLPPWQLALTMSSRQSLLCGCGDDLDDDISAACRLGGHLIAVHDQFRAGLHRILRDLLNITSTTDKSDIPTHPSVGAGHADGQREQGDVYLKLPAT